MSSGPSVLEKAQAMTAEANRLRQGEKAEQDAARVSQRVDEVTEALLGLRRGRRGRRPPARRERHADRGPVRAR